eukprot:scaffold38559_cov237-Amphora_coffeaeformis.AAC.1
MARKYYDTQKATVQYRNRNRNIFETSGRDGDGRKKGNPYGTIPHNTIYAAARVPYRTILSTQRMADSTLYANYIFE